MSTHAFLSASGAPAYMLCHAKPLMEIGLPDVTSAYAKEGTAAHALLEYCLQNGLYPEKLIHNDIMVHGKPSGYFVTEEMAENINITLDLINAIPGKMYPEQRLDISMITGEDGAKGTADVVIVGADTITVVDLKYGMGDRIDAVDNEQLLIYGAAAIEHYDVTGDIKTLRMIISQPRLNHVSEWVLTTKELDVWLAKICNVTGAILDARENGTMLPAVPGVKQCKYCKAKMHCNTYNNTVVSTVSGDFEDLTDKSLAQKVEMSIANVRQIDDKSLADAYDALDLIDSWVSAVKTEVYNRLKADRFNDDRYKLVLGRQGNRKYKDEAVFVREALAVNPELDLYDEKLKSVASLEKLWKKDKQLMAALNRNVVRAEAGVTVAHKSDKRDAINTMLDFRPIED